MQNSVENTMNVIFKLVNDKEAKKHLIDVLKNNPYFTSDDIIETIDFLLFDSMSQSEHEKIMNLIKASLSDPKAKKPILKNLQSELTKTLIAIDESNHLIECIENDIENYLIHRGFDLDLNCDIDLNESFDVNHDIIHMLISRDTHFEYECDALEFLGEFDPTLEKGISLCVKDGISIDELNTLTIANKLSFDLCYNALFNEFNFEEKFNEFKALWDICVYLPQLNDIEQISNYELLGEYLEDAKKVLAKVEKY